MIGAAYRVERQRPLQLQPATRRAGLDNATYARCANRKQHRISRRAAAPTQISRAKALPFKGAGVSEAQTFVDLQNFGNAQATLIMHAIARHANWDTGVCWPSQKTLARMSKCCERTLRSYLIKLERDGFIKRSKRWGTSGSRLSDEIVIVGYAEWLAINREGGTVKKPRAVATYTSLPASLAGSPPANVAASSGNQFAGAPGKQVAAHNEPSLNSQMNTPPQSPAQRGRERGRRRLVEVEVDLDAARTAWQREPAAVALIDDLIAPVASQRHVDAPSVAATLLELPGALLPYGLSPDECADVVARVLRKRRSTVKPSDIEAEARAQIGRRPLAAVLNGDAKLTRSWPDAMAALRGLIGTDQFNAWCTTLVPDSFDGRVFRVVTHEPFIATYVEREFAAPLRVAVQAVWPAAQVVDVRARKTSMEAA